jgi:two-component system sensor histidine kinase PilS (NtrC family)
MSILFRNIISDRIPNVPPATLKFLLQWYLFLRVLFLTVLLGLSVLLQTKSHILIIPPITHAAYFISGVYLFTIISALTLRVIDNYRAFTLLQTVCDTLLVGVIVYATGASQSIFTIIYFLPILAGSFLLLRLGGLLIASVSTMSYGLILFVELFYRPLPFTSFESHLDDVIVAMHFFAIHGLVFFSIAILSLIIFERMRLTESALSQSTLNYDRLQILYKQIFDDITTGIITVDNKNIITSFNQAAEQISGYPGSATLGKQIYDFFPGFRDAEERDIRQTTELIRKNGSSLPVGYSWARLNMPGEDEDSRVYTMQDLTRIRDMEKKVKQAEKMAIIGGMAAGIAHEFRNPLAAISGAAQILRGDASENSDMRRLIEIVVRESDRMDETIADFLLFSKPAEPLKEWFSIKSLVEETIEILEQSRSWKLATCKTVNYIDQDLDVCGDPKQIQQVFLNLISNSCQAFGKLGGEIIISAELRKDAEGKDDAVLMINDDGPGIAPQIMEKIFEPFYTTRESGTGLGLAIVKQILESHGGVIAVKTEPNVGTEFSISLPMPGR